MLRSDRHRRLRLGRAPVGVAVLVLMACDGPPEHPDSPKADAAAPEVDAGVSDPVDAAVDGGGMPGDARLPSPDADLGAMASVPAGPFLRGCNEAIDPACDEDEHVLTELTLSAFEIEVEEVTQARYRDCVEAGDCTVPHCTSGPLVWDPDGTPAHPVVCVTWAQAAAYCAWRGARLPTEAEWEKAARGDNGRRFPWGNAEGDCQHANTGGCDLAPADVGSRPAGASPYGALDLAGNVCEWVADYYSADYFVEAPSVDPTGPTDGTHRAVRDGHFLAPRSDSRTSARRGIAPDAAHPVLGFRCARDAAE
jgi:formylglycine-generating enzyme required for sulfatase activity